MFIFGGLDALRNPEGKVKKADPVARPIAEKVPGLPQDTETLVRINGAVMVGAGTLLAVGKFRRLAALALIGSILPTTYAGHRFWEETDEATRAQQRIHFLKNIGLLGGLILAAVDTEGKPSLSWRAKRHVRRAKRSANPAAADLAKFAGEGIQVAEELLSTLAKSSGPALEQAQKSAKNARKSAKQAQKTAAKAARRGRAKAQPVVASAIKSSGPALEQAQKSARKAVRQGKAKATPVVSAAVKSSGPALDQAEQVAVEAAKRAREIAGEALSRVPIG
jgi:uncharacterized membrane protein YphA (DoxX/SURF4 family)